MRQRNLPYTRQDRDFYPTPGWVTEALLRRVRLPKGIWEPCCGNGAMAQVLEAHGHLVVGTDLVDRGYGEAGRDFRAETRLPESITAIVTNPPYGRRLFAFVDHALELTRPVSGVVAMLFNAQWPYVCRGQQRAAASPGVRGLGRAEKPNSLVRR